MKRKEVLDNASVCVCGKREQDYGKPEDNFGIIADYWNIYLRRVLVPEAKITGADVAMMMALLKIGRINTGTATDDSFVDLAGYAACAAELHEIQLRKDPPVDISEEPFSIATEKVNLFDGSEYQTECSDACDICEVKNHVN